MFNDLKRFIRNKFCKTIQETADSINEFQRRLNEEMCQHYINKLNKVKRILNEFLSIQFN